MKMIREAILAATLAAAMTLSGAALAQSGALTQPNNSAGTPLDRATPAAPRGGCRRAPSPRTPRS